MTAFETEEHKIAVMLRGVSLLMSRARQNELAHLGITPAHAGVLHFAQKFETPCTMQQLRQSMGRSNSAMVGIINRMERDGLIKRQVDHQNKKYTRILLTSKGEALYEKAVNLSVFTTIISSLPREARQKLILYLNTLDKTAREVLEEQQNLKRKRLRHGTGGNSSGRVLSPDASG